MVSCFSEMLVKYGNPNMTIPLHVTHHINPLATLAMLPLKQFSHIETLFEMQ